MGKKQNQGDSTICSCKKYKQDVEINLREKNLWKRFIEQMVTKNPAVWQHYIRQNIIQSKKNASREAKMVYFIFWRGTVVQEIIT